MPLNKIKPRAVHVPPRRRQALRNDWPSQPVPSPWVILVSLFLEGVSTHQNPPWGRWILSFTFIILFNTGPTKLFSESFSSTNHSFDSFAPPPRILKSIRRGVSREQSDVKWRQRHQEGALGLWSFHPGSADPSKSPWGSRERGALIFGSQLVSNIHCF